MSSLRRVVTVSLLAAVAVMLPQSAVAHDELISSDPADGATVATAPEQLTLTFSGQIAEVGAAVNVTDGAQASVVDGDPQVEGTTLVQDLSDDLAAGDYEVVWRVTSQDGHPISGTFGFVVEAGVDDATQEAVSDETADEATEDATAEASEDEATEEVTEDEVTAEATAEETSAAPAEDSQADASAGAEGTGMPAWVWVVVGLGVVGLLALLGRTWSRNRT